MIHNVEIKLELDSTGGFRLASNDPNLVFKQGAWRYSLANEQDMVQLEIRDLTLPNGSVAVTAAYETRGDGSVVQWERYGSLSRSVQLAADTDLDLLVIAVSATAATNAVLGAPPITALHASGKYRIRDTGGGDPD